MASFNKFNAFVADIGLKKHNLNSDTIKIMLTNTAPVATNAVKADITQIASGNGYTTDGNTVSTTAYSQVSGTAKLTGNAVTFTASGGTMATFQYAVLYNFTATNGELIGWWDRGSTLSLSSGDSCVIGKDTSGGNWDSGTPLISIT